MNRAPDDAPKTLGLLASLIIAALVGAAIAYAQWKGWV